MLFTTRRTPWPINRTVADWLAQLNTRLSSARETRPFDKMDLPSKWTAEGVDRLTLNLASSAVYGVDGAESDNE